MENEDIVYLSLLLFSIGFGYFYQKIDNINKKKYVGTLVGLFLVLVVSQLHILHNFITYFINALILQFCNKRICHFVSFFFSFLYLIFFRTTLYFGIPYPPGHTNLVQMMLTLRLVGLAFDVNRNFIRNHGEKKKNDNVADDGEEDEELELSFIEIFHYSFNYIGVLTGPYIRYRTFRDYYNYPFCNYIDWKKATADKLKYVPIYAVLYLVASYYWPLAYAKSDEFYLNRSLIYRFWYIWPNFFIFRMRIYCGLVLSECVCTVACFGAYPSDCEVRPGEGPLKYHRLYKLKDASGQQLKELKYDFESIHNIRPYGSEFCPTFRGSMKHWNMSVQYWLAINIYKQIPNKKYRTFCTMLVSSIWHGVYTGYYVCLLGVPFVLPIEDIYVKLLLKNKSGMALKVAEYFMVFFKMFFFSYLSIAFHLLSLDWIMHYYNSIYHLGIFIGICAYVFGTFFLKKLC